MRDVFPRHQDVSGDAGVVFAQSPALCDITAHLRLIEERPSGFHAGERVTHMYCGVCVCAVGGWLKQPHPAQVRLIRPQGWVRLHYTPVVH